MLKNCKKKQSNDDMMYYFGKKLMILSRNNKYDVYSDNNQNPSVIIMLSTNEQNVKKSVKNMCKCGTPLNISLTCKDCK